ncbi:hypothetical protein [Anoxybacillus sp. J5B_2022]|uniref:hypothetical protein n=1 Tax=Anoxybacillus sp. J5B_2022 TaxID=3003246 RepID=UPI0022869D93|nr:hypothetical protein [Anoxybacillus sp. J5B_2022]MCZ0755096.1 hypothetical protein [Anoxybacillus sp. J5B_2022]
MRNMSLDEVKRLLGDVGRTVDYAVGKFRAQTKEEGWDMKRRRPRDEDEIRALNRICRQKIQRAIKNGDITYDPESRVFIIAKYCKSKEGTCQFKA